MVQLVAALGRREVDDGYAQRGQLIGIRVVADARLLAGDQARETQRLVVGRKQHDEWLVGLAVAGHLLLEDVDVDVGRGKHDVAELAVEIAVSSDRKLAQRLHRQPVAHRMGDDVDALYARSFGQHDERGFQVVAGGGAAVLVVDIVARPAPDAQENSIGVPG